MTKKLPYEAPAIRVLTRDEVITELERQLNANEDHARAHMASCSHCSISPDGDLCPDSRALYEEYCVLTGTLGKLAKAGAESPRGLQ